MKFYTSIFRRAWTITKHHPVLWLFGLFTLFWSGKSLDLELFYTNINLLGSVNSPYNPDFWTADRWNLVTDWLALSSPTMVLLVISLAIAFVLIFGLIMVSQIGLVSAFGKSAKKHDVDVKYTVSDALDASKNHFISVSIVNLLGKAVAYLLLAFAALPLFVGSMSTSAKQVWSALLLVVATVIAVILSIIVKYAVNHMVNGGHDMIVALYQGWRMFRKNIGVSLELAVAMILSFAAVNLVAVIVTALFALPFIIAGNVFGALFGGYDTYALLFVFMYIGGILAITISSMIFSAWHHGCWTLLYSELKTGKKTSKTTRLWKGEKA